MYRVFLRKKDFKPGRWKAVFNNWIALNLHIQGSLFWLSYFSLTFDQPIIAVALNFQSQFFAFGLEDCAHEGYGQSQAGTEIKNRVLIMGDQHKHHPCGAAC